MPWFCKGDSETTDILQCAICRCRVRQATTAMAVEPPGLTPTPATALAKARRLQAAVIPATDVFVPGCAFVFLR